MRKLPARKLLGAIIAGALLLPETAFTLGLGEIEVNSALNQKLNADIELLSATPEDTENIIVKLASRKEFSRAGIDRPYLLNDLRFKSEIKDGVPHIMVSSASPIREPFLNFLVEIDWPNGHLLREYTVLLDPPVFMTQSSSAAPVNKNASANADFRPSSTGSANVVPVVAPEVSSSFRPEAGATAPAVAAQTSAPAGQQSSSPVFVPAPVMQQQGTINQPSGSYRIQAGDTAWSLADAMRPDQSISVEQMMIAMLRSNPESFINENINGLKRGYILRVPDYNQITTISQQDARELVREQAALWRQYQQSQAGGQPVSAMPADGSDESVYSDDGAVITGEENDAYLEIVSAGSGTSTMSGKDPTDMTPQELRAELALARERVETERVEKEALQQRINQLEQSAGKMDGMLSIEDAELAEVQSLNMPVEGELTEGEQLEADLVEDAAVDMAESAAETDDLLAEQTLEDAISEEAGAEGEDGEITDESAVFLDEAGSEQAAEEAELEDEQAQTEPEAEKAPVKQKPQIVSRPPEDPLTQLLNDPVLLAAAGGGLLLIAALIGLIIKRRKTAADTKAEFEAPAMVMESDDLESLADEVAESAEEEVVVESLAGDQSADIDESEAEEDFASDSTMILDSVEDTIIAEEDTSAVADDEPRDDVIAEADVYLAYGIYQQAEELLTQAIADNPDRDDYRVKLAETHYASKNADAFLEVAKEIKKNAGDDNTPAWKKVMGMGQDLCSDNPMFQGSMVGGLDMDALSPKAPEMDFDLGMDDTGGSPDLDLSFDDDEPLELPDMDEIESKSSEDLDDNATQILEFDAEDAGAVSEAAEPSNEIEFDLSDTGAVDEAETAEDEFSLDIDASELDFDIADEADTEDKAAESDEVQDVSDVDIDFGLEDSEAATVEEDEDISIDLSDEAESLDMDLGDAAVEEASLEDMAESEAPELETPDFEALAEPAAETGDLSDEDDFDLSSLDDVDEVSTKLDLARAYLDMGDHEGTRGILEEVLAEGNDAQKEEANELMAKLD